MAGCSGGGTQSACRTFLCFELNVSDADRRAISRHCVYCDADLSALDDRVAASSIACYMTTFERLFEYIGPQDAEQVWPAGFSAGLDLPDLVEVRAPKPTQLLFTNDDQIFPIQVQ